MTKAAIKRLLAGALALALVLGPAPGAFAQNYWWWQVVNETDEPFTEEGEVRCRVYSPNSTGAAILHTTSALTAAYRHALASSVNGVLHFWSSTYGDGDVLNVKCFTQYGDYAYKSRMTRATHKIRINTSGAQKISQFEYFLGRGGQNAAGITLPQGAFISGIGVDRVGVVDGAHLNVGFGGNHLWARWNALVNRLAVDQAGFIRVHSTGLLQTSTVITPDAHLGIAMVLHTNAATGGLTVLNRFVEVGVMVHQASGLDITYNTASTANLDSTTGGGHVYILWTQMHVGINRQPLR